MQPDHLIGKEIAGYRIEAQVGRGGMGRVYRAIQLGLNRPVALKILSAELAQDETFRARFLKEAQLAATLEHPNILPIHEVGEDGGQLFMAMRLVEGTDLGTLLRQNGPLAPARTLALLAQAADALDFAHAAGLVHRDVKPANLLLAGDLLYLADFGIAKAVAARRELTRTGIFIGTIDYASPEQIRNEPLSAATDIYALGGVLYQCLTGAVPFDRPSEFLVMQAHLQEPPPKPSEHGLPAALDAVIATAMAKAPDERHRSARRLVEALRAALEGRAAPSALPPTVAGPIAAVPPTLIHRAPATMAEVVTTEGARTPRTGVILIPMALAAVATWMFAEPRILLLGLMSPAMAAWSYFEERGSGRKQQDDDAANSFHEVQGERRGARLPVGTILMPIAFAGVAAWMFAEPRMLLFGLMSPAMAAWSHADAATAAATRRGGNPWIVMIPGVLVLALLVLGGMWLSGWVGPTVVQTQSPLPTPTRQRTTGATPEELTQLKHAFDAQRSRIDDLIAAVTFALNSVDWQGPAHDRFAAYWAGDSMRALRNLQQALQEAGREANLAGQNTPTTPPTPQPTVVQTQPPLPTPTRQRTTGATPEELTQLKRVFDAQSQRIEELITAVTVALNSVDWQGPAHDPFAAYWAGEAKVALRRLQQALEEAGREANLAGQNTPTTAPTPTPAGAGYPGGIANASGPTNPGFTRYGGKVTDAATGAPIAGVCVYAGPPAGCTSPSIVTDASGNYAVDFLSGNTWQFNFEHPLYVAQLQRIGTTLSIQMVRK